MEKDPNTCAQANPTAATAVYNAVSPGMNAIGKVAPSDRYDQLEAARRALHSAFDASLQAIGFAK